ncbi:MAG: hypothetical protein LHV68_02375 [Elusimicrobia bacterium]|nr:hypothetical protein [Candidatus Liberimonas magnetica]
MKYNKLTILVSIIIINAGVSFADTRSTFLSHGPSVEAYGRGDTGTSFLDSIASVYYNPALIANMNNYDLDASFYSLFDESSYGFLGAGIPLKNDSYLAISGICLRSGNVEIRQNINDAPEGIRTSQWAYSVALAKTFKKLYMINVGLNVKYVDLMLYNYRGGSFGADFGASKGFNGPVIDENQSRINIGFNIQNLVQPKITMISDEEVYNPVYRLGFSLNLPVYSRPFSYDSLGIYTDFADEEDAVKCYIGLEYAFFNKIYLRSGYYKGNMTAGIGFNNNSYAVNYAADFVDYATFHRIGLSYYWEKNEKTPASKPVVVKETSLMDEAKKALEKNKELKKENQKEIRSIFVSAKRYFKKKKYLTASDKFSQLILKYPEYKIAKEYYEKINVLMDNESKDNEAIDLEKVSYAKAFVYYKEQKLKEAVNEWEKALAINPKADELKEYLAKVKGYLNDIERQSKENEIEGQIKNIYESGLEDYNSSKWVNCIKKMEEVLNICRKHVFKELIQWQEKAQRLIEGSLNELSKSVSKKPVIRPMTFTKQSETEVNSEGAQKKYNEGLILYAQGKTSDAIRIWEIAIRLDPGFEKAYKAIEKAKEELGPIKK